MWSSSALACFIFCRRVSQVKFLKIFKNFKNKFRDCLMSGSRFYGSNTCSTSACIPIRVHHTQFKSENVRYPISTTKSLWGCFLKYHCWQFFGIYKGICSGIQEKYCFYWVLCKCFSFVFFRTKYLVFFTNKSDKCWLIVRWIECGKAKILRVKILQFDCSSTNVKFLHRETR